MVIAEPVHEDVARLIRSDDADAVDHGDHVAAIAERIARALGFSPHRCRRIRLAGLLHDVGKTLIATSVLDKPGPLDAPEWSQVRLHPVLGEQILVGEGLTDIAPWVRAHHERFDGRGYPDGMLGAAIPIEARILAVADAYDAMTTGRPYSPALDPDRACEELRREAGGQFDPRVVAAFLSVRDRADDRGAVAPPAFSAN